MGLAKLKMRILSVSIKQAKRDTKNVFEIEVIKCFLIEFAQLKNCNVSYFKISIMFYCRENTKLRC
jgi:hypothetical protein